MKTGAQRVIGYEIAIDGEGCGQGVVTGDRRRSGQTIRGKAARLLRQKTRRVTKVPPLDQWLQDPRDLLAPGRSDRRGRGGPGHRDPAPLDGRGGGVRNPPPFRSGAGLLERGIAAMLISRHRHYGETQPPRTGQGGRP